MSKNLYDVIIEIPLGSRIKYEYDKEYNMIRVDRYLLTPTSYPFNYGYFPNTLAEDNDPLDAILLINEPLIPGCIIECDIIGGIEMIDNNEIDHKIFVVPGNKLNFIHKKLTNEFEKEIRFFLENYKKLENKNVTLGKLLSKEESIEIYNKSKL